MALFGSQEWLDEFCQALNSDPEYQEAAQGYEGDMICVCLPEEGVCGELLAQYYNPYHGRIKEWAVLSDPEEREAAFVLTADYSVWKKICQGQLDMMKAVMTRKLKVKGRMSQLMKQTKAARALIKVMAGLSTTFHDE